MKVISLISLCALVICCTVKHNPDATCECDTLKPKSQLFPISIDSATEIKSFYENDSRTNQQLWFKDIESIDSTQYTRLWDDYHRNNYHASHKKFKAHYDNASDTELAFQIGPAGPLWTYYTFVLTKKECCFVFTRTSFAHARFRYKGYSFLTKQKVDSLFDCLRRLHKSELMAAENFMTATFIDNRNDESFNVPIGKFGEDDHGSMPPDSAIVKFLQFVHTRIKWTETYPLDPEDPEEKIPKNYDQFVISGNYVTENDQGKFKAKVTVEKRETHMYYTWDIVSENGILLAAKSSTIDFKQIVRDSDQFHFAKKYVIKEIREYKVKNKKIVNNIAEPF